MPGARRIGGDWVESVDPKSGKVYYANMRTKETSWVMPEEVKEFQEQRARQATMRTQTSETSSTASGPSSSAGNSGSNTTDQWLERQDPRTGRVYYYNPQLKQTSWTRPDNTVTAATSDPSFGKGSWVARVDPRTNRTFYYNTITKMTSWTNPDEDEKDKKPVSKPSIKSRVSQRLSFSPKATDQPAYENESRPAAPTNRTSARTSIRLGAMPGPKAGSRLSMADVARQKKIETAGLVEEPVEAPDTMEDRFAKLRALRNRADPNFEQAEQEQEQEQEMNLEDLAKEAVDEVDYNLDFHAYAQEHMSTKRKGWGKKPVTVDKLITWKPEKIKTSLHPLGDPALVHDSILAFTNILCYMGDKPTKNPIQNAEKIFRVTVGCPEELRDEVYCQLIKQTTGNPNPSSCVRGWELLVLCTGLFPPSAKLQRYLLSYFKRASMDQNPAIVRLANYSTLRLSRTMDLGPRNEAPTELEIQAACAVKPALIRVYMLDGSITPLEAECWTTIADLNNKMADRLKIKDKTPFGVFEIDSLDQERILEDDDRVLDILSFWDRERRNAKRSKNAPNFQFVYKVKLFFDIREDDEAAIEVAYHQAVHDVVDSRYPCTEEDSLRLAALQAQHRFGDYDGRDVFGDDLKSFLPPKYYHQDVEDDLKLAITETYKLLKGYDPQEAMNNYLDYVKAWKIYGSAYFFVEPQNSRAELPPDVVLAVNAHGVLIVDPTTKDFLSEYPYSEIVTWGHSSITFVLVVGNLIRQNKLYFKTYQGSEINSLVHAYVNRLVEE